MSEILGSLFKYFLALLGVGAVIAVMVQAVSTNKAALHASQIGQLSAAIEQLYSNSHDFTNLSTATVLTVAPTAMVSGASILNPWGGTVTAAADANNSAHFTITTTAVPTADCVKLVTAVSTATGTTIGSAVQLTGTPDPATVATDCAKATAEDVTFTFSGI